MASSRRTLAQIWARDPRFTSEPLSWPGALAVQPDGARLFVADLGDWATIVALNLETGP